MNRCIICLFLLLFVCIRSQTFAQQRFDTLHVNKNALFAHPVFSIKSSNVTALRHGMLPVQINVKSTPVLKAIPENYYANHLGFFCTKELQVQKITNLPLSFRLGSVQYTNQMEGKNAPLR